MFFILFIAFLIFVVPIIGITLGVVKAKQDLKEKKLKDQAELDYRKQVIDKLNKV